jgi:hypothetical protein
MNLSSHLERVRVVADALRATHNIGDLYRVCGADVKVRPSIEEISVVASMTGFSEDGAVRVLMLRERLIRFRQEGVGKEGKVGCGTLMDRVNAFVVRTRSSVTKKKKKKMEKKKKKNSNPTFFRCCCCDQQNAATTGESFCEANARKRCCATGT